MRTPNHLLPLFLLTAAGCHGSNPGEEPPIVLTELRVEGSRTHGGEGDALAAALLLSTGEAVRRPGRAEIALADEALRQQLARMSRTHLRAASLTSASGPGQAGSAAIRRLAADPGAPQDRNGDGNLDETLELHYRQLAEYADSPVPPVMRPILFPWVDGNAEFASAPDPRDPTAPTRAGRVGHVDAEQIGEAILARVMLASRLLRERHGTNNYLGATAEDGMLGLVLLQQAAAMEETVFAQLFADGRVLGSMQFPKDYQPSQGLQWVPRGIQIGVDRNGNAATFSISDRSSGLAALSSLIRAGAEMSFLASTGHSDDPLREVFRGQQIGRLPELFPRNNPAGNTWEDGVDRLLKRECAVCHDSRFPPEPGLFAADSYENVHRGGRRSRPGSEFPIIVRGNAEQSVLYYILLADPPNGFFRMPDNGPRGPFLKDEEIKMVKDWIDAGARSAPPAPPEIGVDLLATMYKNLVAMHLGPGGVLFERHDGDAPVPFANPAATGAALQALAAAAHAEARLPGWGTNLRSAAGFAAARLVRADGAVFRSFDVNAGTADGEADLYGHARLASGLFAAARVLASASLLERALAVARRLQTVFFDAERSLFRSEPQADGVRYSPRVVAAVLDALREMAFSGVAGAESMHGRFLARLLPVLAFAEVGGGEVLGDGEADTDGNGLKEPALAGGAFGLAPLFAGQIVEGETPAPPGGTITWSTHIQPLFRENCGICHMDGSSRGEGYFLDTPALARRTTNPANPMPLIVPFDPENSFLYRKLVERNPAFGAQMPLSFPPLAAHGTELVRRWILEGASAR